MSGANRDGFTLLEAVVALAIVGTVAVAALATLGAELRAADRAQETLTATALAEHRLASIRLLPASELPTLPDSLRRGSFRPPFERYRWRAELEPVMGEDGLYTVRVRIEWGEDGAYSLATRLYRPRRPGTP